MAEPKKYRPSNGTEGEYFHDKFCYNCIHENPNPERTPKCVIMTNAFLHDVKEPEYPTEWTYDAENKPTCTAWVKWDWGSNDDENGRNEPPVIIPDDPNQLCMPFELEQMEFEKKPILTPQPA